MSPTGYGDLKLFTVLLQAIIPFLDLCQHLIKAVIELANLVVIKLLHLSVVVLAAGNVADGIGQFSDRTGQQPLQSGTEDRRQNHRNQCRDQGQKQNIAQMEIEFVQVGLKVNRAYKLIIRTMGR